jgi:glycosyltransferase involved in cell wall biosynthesis
MNTLPKITLICPTRNRPSFVEKSLEFFAKLNHTGIELIVVDNSSQGLHETQNICVRQTDQRVRYVRTEHELSMIDNWEFALSHATGEYVGFLTDKMFILPDAFQKILDYLSTAKPQILSWHADAYTPDITQDYFGAGIYSKGLPDSEDSFKPFNPLEELQNRVRGTVPRTQMLANDYSRGKICFGLYSNDLISEIKTNFGRLFWPISPDYTSMVFALGTATTAIECSFAAIVHVNTDLSNGNLISLHDASAMNFLKTVENYNEIIERLPIPKVYVSINNLVLHDYIYTSNQMNLALDLSPDNWIQQIYNDIYSPDRQWSSIQICDEQKTALEAFLQTTSIQIDRKLNKNFLKSLLAISVSKVVPLFLKTYYQRLHHQGNAKRISSIGEII